METDLYQLSSEGGPEGLLIPASRAVCVLHLSTKLTDLLTDALLDGSTQIFSECKGQGSVGVRAWLSPV